jgi:carboxyl-terminal processing protease
MLESAVDVASLFFPKGTLIFRTRGRKTDVTKDFATSRDGPFSTLPLIVLLNERSASAAEALAGSLQDHDRALVVGRRSFGKGLMQTPMVLAPTGDIVMLTIGRVVTPSGRVIQRRYRSIGFEQYLSFAGTPGAPEDTVAVFKTDHGREVRGGGGIAPDVVRPLVSELPLWWSVANDSGFALAVADSVAATLPSTPAAREAWVSSPARWSTDLLAPFLQRVRRRLHVAAAPDTAVSARMARYLASRVAAVRWPEDGAAELRIRNDPDILIALPYFGRLPTLLGGAPR